MTDKELLELAAKAGGYNHYEYVENNFRNGCEVWGHYDSLCEVCINPLTDDGDALRLAVKCDLSVQPGGKTCRFVVVSGACGQILEERKPDEYAATRRAIVRAAASIGEQMK